MDWIRRNALALFIILAVVASFVINRQESIDRDHAQAQTLVSGCVLSNTGRALLSSWQRSAADARRESGDVDVADEYEAYANGTADSLAIAQYIDDPTAATQVKLIHTGIGPQFVLTDESEALIEKGCRLQYE